MPTSSHIAHSLLQSAHDPDTASTLFKDKVLHKPLRLRPTSPDPSSLNARSKRRLQRLRKTEKSRRKQKPKPLSAKEKRITGIYDVKADHKIYEIYVPLHEMWCEYIREILGLRDNSEVKITAQSAGSHLVSADYHGAKMRVVRSRCAGMVGLEGIVIRDSKFTFQVITRGHQLKVIPKRHTVFRFEIPRSGHAKGAQQEETGTEKTENGSEDTTELPPIVFELQGSQFEYRAADRANKKFKPKNLTEI